MLLAVTQASPPAPRKTADPTAGGSESATKNQNSTDAQPTVPKRTESKVDQDGSRTPVKETPKAVKDPWDKAYVVFTGLLVVIGALGVGFAIKTLRAIERQALSMRRQTTHLKNSVVQARRAANAAKKSAEFAELATKASERADVLLDAAGLSTGREMTPQSRVVLRFKNYGRTRANQVNFSLRVMIPETPDGKALSLPPTPMGAGDFQTVSFQMFTEWVTKDSFEKIPNGESVMRFAGTVSYRDMFDECHTTRCSGTFHPKVGAFMVDENNARLNDNP